VYRNYTNKEEVWGLRRLCLQLAPEMIEVLDATKDVEAIKFILDFLMTSLKKPIQMPESNTNSEKWVRNCNAELRLNNPCCTLKKQIRRLNPENH
jgi:hypothetical protein